MCLAPRSLISLTWFGFYASFAQPFCAVLSFPLHFLVQISISSLWAWLLASSQEWESFSESTAKGILVSKGNSSQKSTEIRGKNTQKRSLTSCQEIDFALAGNGAAVCDCSCYSVGSKGLAIIRMCSRTSWVTIPWQGISQGTSGHLKRGAVSPVTASTKLGCFQ